MKAGKSFQASASSLEQTLHVKRAHSDRADIMTKMDQWTTINTLHFYWTATRTSWEQEVAIWKHYGNEQHRHLIHLTIFSRLKTTGSVMLKKIKSNCTESQGKMAKFKFLHVTFAVMGLYEHFSCYHHTDGKKSEHYIATKLRLEWFVCLFFLLGVFCRCFVFSNMLSNEDAA